MIGGYKVQEQAELLNRIYLSEDIGIDVVMN